MTTEQGDSNLHRAAELFLQIKDEADPLASPLLEGEPAAVVEQVKQMLRGVKAPAPASTGATAGGMLPRLLAAGVLVVIAVSLGFYLTRDSQPGRERADQASAVGRGQAPAPESSAQALPDSSWARVLDARAGGQQPDAGDEAEVRALLGEELWAEVAGLLTGEGQQPTEAFRSRGDDPLIGPRNVIDDATPVFRFRGLGEDPSTYDYRVSITRLDDLEEVAQLRVAGDSVNGHGELEVELPEDAALQAGDAEPVQYMWSMVPLTSSGQPAASSSDFSAVFGVASATRREALLAGIDASGQVGFDCIHRALVFEKHAMIELALAELEKIPGDVTDAELGLRDRLRNRMREAANLPPLGEPELVLAELDGLVTISSSGAEAMDPKQLLAQLKETAEKELQAAKELFSAQAEVESEDEYIREIRRETRTRLDAALLALERIIDQFPDEEKWAESRLEDGFSLSFWVDRFTTIDDFDYEAEMARIKKGEPAEPASAKPAPRNESFEVAIEKAKKAESSGDSAAAFYEYLDAIENQVDPDAEGLLLARNRLKAIRGSLNQSELISYLKKELKAKDAARRSFAAQELGALRSSFTVSPLVRALKGEDDAGVRSSILGAFRKTQKRASADQLASLSSSRDEQLKLDVLETLQTSVGGRYGALAAVEFLGDRSQAVSERALQAMQAIGGSAGALALGKAAASRGTSKQLTERIFRMLVELGNATAAEVLIPHCTRKSDNREAAEDALVELAEPAILPCINALSIRRVASSVNDVLQRMTGQTIGQTQRKWMDWYERWKANGGFGLPRYARGAEPWKGFGR